MVAERFACHRGVINQLLAHELTQVLVLRQLVLQVVRIGQVGDIAHAVRQHDLVEALVGVRVAHDAHERRQARAGAKQIEVLAGLEVGEHQGTGGLARHQQRIAGLEVLQARGERTVLHLDRQELQVLLPARAGDRVGAHQRAAVHLHADHHELPAVEAEAWIARGAEGKQAVVPVPHVDHVLGRHRYHLSSLRPFGGGVPPTRRRTRMGRRWPENLASNHARGRVHNSHFTRSGHPCPPCDIFAATTGRRSQTAPCMASCGSRRSPLKHPRGDRRQAFREGTPGRRATE